MQKMLLFEISVMGCDSVITIVAVRCDQTAVLWICVHAARSQEAGTGPTISELSSPEKKQAHSVCSGHVIIHPSVSRLAVRTLPVMLPPQPITAPALSIQGGGPILEKGG